MNAKLLRELVGLSRRLIDVAEFPHAREAEIEKTTQEMHGLLHSHYGASQTPPPLGVSVQETIQTKDVNA